MSKYHVVNGVVIIDRKDAIKTKNEK